MSLASDYILVHLTTVVLPLDSTEVDDESTATVVIKERVFHFTFIKFVFLKRKYC